MKLLELFKELSLHPKNAAELKALILQLAVQGKLTAKWREENPDVEPASELLKRIEGENERLVKEKNIKKEKNTQKNKAKEISAELPKSWVSCKFGDLVNEIKGGGTPSKNNPAFWNGEIPWASVKDLKDYRYLIKTQDSITELGLGKSSSNLIPEDSLIICTRMGLGKISINKIPIAINQDLKAVTLSEYVDIEFVYDQYRTLSIKGSGMTVAGIKQDELLNIPFVLPPLQEQHAIVTTVNQLFAEVEQLEQLTQERIQMKHDFATSALQRLVQAGNINGEWAAVQQHFHTFFNEKPNVKKLRETILQLAVQGKLTTHWRKENPGLEPATELLKRITAEKQQLIKSGKIKKEKPLPPIKDDEIPFELPEGWVWCRLGEVIRFMAYGTSQKTNDDYKQVPVLRMGNISSDGKLNFNNLKYIPKNHKDLPGLYLANGDIVFNRTNSYELVGKSGVFWGEDKSFTLASYLIKVSVFLSHVLPDYLNLYITSPVCRKTQIEPEITAQTNQANFSGSKLKNVYCPIPPTKEQQAIVTTVNILMALCDALEQELGQQESRVEELMRSCVREVME